MPRADDGEVAAIQCGDDLDSESFGERHDGGVHRPKRQIVVARYELRDPHPITWQHRRGGEVSRRKVSEEPHFCFPSEARFDEIGDFGDDEFGDE
jgi:hypothetical protein